MTDEESLFFENGSLVYPQPVAMSCGKILRTRTPEALIDTVIKGAEILTRYLATISLASFSVRNDPNILLSDTSLFSKPLAFGAFHSIVQQVVSRDTSHIAKYLLQEGFNKKKISSNSKIKSLNTDDSIQALMKLRNTLGHDIAAMTKSRASSILQEVGPHRNLIDAIRGVENLLYQPLFVVEQQQVTRGKIYGERLMLMGEASDPVPETIELSEYLHWDSEPYLAIGCDVLPLNPMLAWRNSPDTANNRLFIFDTIQDKFIKYKAVENSTYKANDSESIKLIQEKISGVLSPKESRTLANGTSFSDEWTERRNLLEQSKKGLVSLIPWNSFDPKTLNWYLSKFPNEGSDANKIIENLLLDGRDRLNNFEKNQLLILFGKEELVKKTIGRELIDLRFLTSPNLRWEERVESHSNIIECLKISIDFFSRHIGINDTNIDSLTSTTGSEDYLAMREALVNLFIHQDYNDQSAASQIVISAHQVSCFNPGKSLVKANSLIEGGKSQCRNPLVARALRLIGFSELAGSGLRQVQNSWRTLNRRPPEFDSNETANTFSLKLDWRDIPDNFNKFWFERLGVKLTPAEVTILNISVDHVTIEKVASATGLSIESSKDSIDKLVRQALIEKTGEVFVIKPHLRELIINQT
jgi:hypothetical protein